MLSIIVSITREWWRTGAHLRDDKVANRSFHRYLVSQLLVMADDPVYAYERCIKGVDKFIAQDQGDLTTFRQEYSARVLLREIYGEPLTAPDQLSLKVAPIQVEVPIFKNPVNEPDVLEAAQFQFNLSNLSLVSRSRLGIVIGGSPHSGKSTAASSLYYAMSEVVEQAERVGLEEISIGWCDLDLAAPTLKYIMQGEKPPAETRKNWALEDILQAHRNFDSERRNHNVTIGDLPGGKPDGVTAILLIPAHYSVVIDKDYTESMRMWQDYFLGAGLPIPLAGAHSRHERGRVSGVRSYDSISRRDKRNFLGGRVVNLDHVPQPDDPFISFAAKVLLLDYLPQMVLARNEYKRNLGRSLGLIKEDD